MNENEFILYDRLEVIKQTINKYGEENFYLAFSGGKDSTVVHHLLDMALPNNQIPRVFSNTGIEYNLVLKFVKELMKTDSRIKMIYPRKNIKEMLEEVGYPFKSKEHSMFVDGYQTGHSLDKPYIKKYLTKERFGCPKMLRYQFTDQFMLRVSDKCCKELKKNPSKQYAKQTGKKIRITGMMKEEGGQRTKLSCILTKGDKLVAFHPLAKVTGEWEEWFINQHDIKLCELYYEPFNFKRTGCKGCPYSLDLQRQLDVMDVYLPAERKQCEYIWEPVYTEYRRLGYRLDSEVQTKLF